MSPDEKLCPICGKPNLCGVDLAGKCWCVRVEVPRELIEGLPVRGKACICRDCINAFKRNSGAPEPR